MVACVKCGKPLMEDMRFCPYCGQPLDSEEVDRFEPRKGETITAVISPATVSGLEGTFALAFTEERVLIARTGEVVADKTKGELLNAGIFLPGSTTSANVSRFYEMSPEEVLSEGGDNMSLDNSDVEAVRLAYDSSSGGHYVVSLRTGERTLIVTLPYDRYYRDLFFRQYEGRITW